MADCLEQIPGMCPGLLANFHLFLELKHACFFCLFVFLNKTTSIPEWLPQCGMTRNGSGIRNLGLSWMCFLVSCVWDRPGPPSPGPTSSLTNGSKAMFRLTQCRIWKQRVGDIFLFLSFILPPWRHAIPFHQSSQRSLLFIPKALIGLAR